MPFPGERVNLASPARRRSVSSHLINKRRLRTLVLLCLTILMSGCAFFAAAPSAPYVRLPGGGYFTLLKPRQMGEAQSVSQFLQGEFAGKAVSMLFQWELSPEQLVLVATTAMGQPLLTVQYVAEQVSTDMPVVNFKGLRGEYLLADMQLAYAPLPALELALKPEGYEIISGFAPLPFRQLRKGGKLISEFRYSDATPWPATVTVQNHAWDYHYEITTLGRSLSVEPSTPINTEAR